MRTWKTILVSILLLALLAACGRPVDEPMDLSQRKVRVVTTIGMITDAVENVGGERVEVTGLMGAGVDPHLYKASAKDVIRLQEADLILYNGLHLEAQMGEVLTQMPGRIRTVAVAEAIDPAQLLSPADFEGTHDPHVWFDVALWMQVVEEIQDSLVELDPAHAAVYEANAAAYLAELNALHHYVKSQAQRVPAEQRVLITAHDAFNYFGRAYDFEVRGLQGVNTSAEAGTADVRDLADLIAERRIPAIFVETSVQPRYIEAVQAAVADRGFSVRIGGEIFSDALGSRGTPEGTYVGMVRHNIDTIVGALLGE